MQANKPSRKTGRRAAGKQVINQTRHEAHCTVCAHPERAEIEQAFVNWVSPVRIASQFTVSSDAVYRHRPPAVRTDLLCMPKPPDALFSTRQVQLANRIPSAAEVVEPHLGILAR